MDAAQFDELRGVLKMTGPELLTRFRELGTKATPVMRGKGARSYHLALLQDGKTLQESLPGIRMGRKAGGR